MLIGEETREEEREEGRLATASLVPRFTGRNSLIPFIVDDI